jgi:hypothetical protein
VSREEVRVANGGGGAVYTTILLPPVTEYVPSTVYTTVYVPSYVTLPYYVPTAVGTTPAAPAVRTTYLEVSYPVVVPVPVEVAQPVVAVVSEDAGTEVGDAVTLRSVYVEVPLPIAIPVPVEVGGVVPVSESSEELAEHPETATLSPAYLEVSYPLGLVYEEVVPVVVARESSEVLAEHSETTTRIADVQLLRSLLLPQVSELESLVSRASSRADLEAVLGRYAFAVSTYRASGVSDPELESRLGELRARLESLVQLAVLAELASLDPRSPEQALARLRELESWLQGLARYGLSAPTAVATVSEVRRQLEELLAQRGVVRSRLAARDREVLDFLASRLARLYAIAEFVSRDTWEALRRATGLTDENVRLIMRYIRGEGLSEDELRRLAELYVALQHSSRILDHEAILRELEKLIPTPGAVGAVERRWTLADYERMLKERVLRGEELRASPGRQVAWSIENVLGLLNVLGRGTAAVSDFLKGLGVPAPIASGIASFLTTFGTVLLSAVPVVGPPLALALVGTALADTSVKLLEALGDEYERSVFTEEFLRILDPSRAPPELRAQYEAMRLELLASIAGGVAGAATAATLRGIVSEKLAQLLAKRYPKLAERIQYKLGELVPKEQEWVVRFDKGTGELVLARYERGVLKIVGRLRLDADSRVVAALAKPESGREVAALLETLRRVTGKEDVSEELRWILGRLAETLRTASVEPTDDVIREALGRYSKFVESLLKSLPEELKGRSLLEVTRQVAYVNAGGRLVPALDLGEKMVLSVGDKTVTVTKGALAAVGTVERLKSLGILDDVVNLLRRGLGQRGFVVRPDLNIVVELTQDGKLVVTRGLTKEILTAFDPRYLLEARQLLETLDPSVVKALSTVITVPHAVTLPPQTAVPTAVDAMTKGLMESLTSKLGGTSETVVLSGGGKAVLVSVNRELFGTLDSRVLTTLQDLVLARNLAGLRSLLGPAYERFTLFTARLSQDLAGKLASYLDLGRPVSTSELLRAVSEAMRTASGTELAQLRVLQLLLQSSPGTVIPVATASTAEGVTLVLATAVPALAQLTLTAEDLRRLGIEERAVTQGLRAVYVETTYPVAVPRVVEVSRTVHTYASSEVVLDRSEELPLRPYYSEVPLPIAVPRVVEHLEYVFRSDSVELAHATEDSLGLKPTYLDVPYPVPRVLPQELTRVIHVPDAREVPYGVGDVMELVPAYLELYYPVPSWVAEELAVPAYAVWATESLGSWEEVARLEPAYAEELYPVPATLPLELLRWVYATLEDELSLEADQPADAYVVTYAVPTFVEVYYPYTEPLQLPEALAGIAPPAVAGVVGYPGALPWGAVPGRREEAEAVARLRKPKELEKVVL